MSFVDRYGEAIEADLHHEYGVDLLDFFRGRYSWRKLRVLMQKLPSTSLMNEAMAQDDELAAEFIGTIEDHKDPGPRLTEYTLTVERLDVLSDQIKSLAATIISVAGGKPGQPRPAKRPETALSRARDARALARHNSLLDEVAAAQERWTASHK